MWPEDMWTVSLLPASIVVLYLGLALLALSQDRHWRAIGATRPLGRPSVVVVRIAGYGPLPASLAVVLVREGTGFAALLWSCLLMAVAFAVTATPTWRARWLRPLARIVASDALALR